MSLTSDELNYLVYRYLLESGELLPGSTCKTISRPGRHGASVACMLPHFRPWFPSQAPPVGPAPPAPPPEPPLRPFAETVRADEEARGARGRFGPLRGPTNLDFPLYIFFRLPSLPLAPPGPAAATESPALGLHARMPSRRRVTAVPAAWDPKHDTWPLRAPEAGINAPCARRLHTHGLLVCERVACHQGQHQWG